MATLFLISLSATIILVLFLRLRLPPIVGFIVTGILLGPSGTGILHNPEELRTLTELGVILLLFSIGLELPLSDLLTQKRGVVLGVLQVSLTTIVLGGVLWAIRFPLLLSFYLAFAFSLSSTAMGLKWLSDRGEIHAPHGKLLSVILIVQDLLILPGLLILSLLWGEPDPIGVQGYLRGFVKIIAVGVVFVLARAVVPPLLFRLLSLKQKELFLMFVLLLLFGSSLLARELLHSPALGAFLAGVLIAESPFAKSVLTEVLPLRDLFLSLFFIGAGTILEVRKVVEDFPLVGGLTLGFLFLKAVVAFSLLKWLGYPRRTSVYTTFGILPAGEFSFLLLDQGVQYRLLPGEDFALLLSALFASLLLSPFFLSHLEGIQGWLDRLFPEREAGLQKSLPKEKYRDHAIVVGLGLNGTRLVQLFQECKIPVVGVDLNPALLAPLLKQGIPVLYGDATRAEILKSAGFESARVLVVTISDPGATRAIVMQARNLHPRVPIVARTHYLLEAERILRAGATSAVADEKEVTQALILETLKAMGFPEGIALTMAGIAGKTPSLSEPSEDNPQGKEETVHEMELGGKKVEKGKGDPPRVEGGADVPQGKG